MKTCEQMTADVFRRMDEYKIKQKKRRKIIAAVAAPLCSLCLVTAVGLWLGGGAVAMDNAAPESAAMNGSVYYSEDAESLQESPANMDVMCIYEIFIQELEEVPEMQTQQGICLFVDDFVAMTDEEINGYYGVNVFPVVPADLSRVDERLGIYRRNGGTGEVYYDHIRVAYEDKAQQRCVAAQAYPKTVKTYGYSLLEKLPAHSLIGNTPVAIAKLPDGSYYAEFRLENAGFCVWTTGLSEQETVDVIASLIIK